MKLFSHRSHFGKSFLYLDGEDGYIPAEPTEAEITIEANLSEFAGMSFEGAQQHLESTERTNLTNHFKQLYSKYDNNNHAEEIALRVENILEKMRLIVPETTQDSNTPPLDVRAYRGIIAKYANKPKTTGNIGAFEKRPDEGIFISDKSQSHELEPKSNLPKKLKYWLNEESYTFKKGRDPNGIEIWCENKFITYVPRGIVEIWPIMVNGEVQGFVTMDGDGDMASRFAGGAMHFLKEVKTGEGENTAINVEEDRKGEPQRAKFDAHAESSKRRTLEDYGNKEVKAVVQETAFKVAQAAQPAATPAAPSEPEPAPADQADSKGSQSAQPRETVTHKNQPETFPNIEKLPRNISEALNTLFQEELLNTNAGAILEVSEQGKITKLKLTQKTGANTTETKKALFTIANFVLPEGVSFPDTCEEALSHIFVDRTKLISWILDAESVGRKLNDEENLFFADLPKSKFRKIRIHFKNWELSEGKDGSFTATEKVKAGKEAPKTETVHGIGRRDDPDGDIKIGFIDADGNWIKRLGRNTDPTATSEEDETPTEPPPPTETSPAAAELSDAAANLQDALGGHFLEESGDGRPAKKRKKK